MKVTVEGPREQLAQAIFTGTVELLLGELNKGFGPGALKEMSLQARNFLETFTPGDIAENATAAVYCLEHKIIPDGHTEEELTLLKNMTMSIYEAKNKEE